MGVRTRWAALLVLPATLVLTACSAGTDASAGASDSTPTAIVAPAADCLSPAVLRDLGLMPASTTGAESSETSTPEAGAVPEDFVPVSVVVCTPDGSLHDASGTWLALTASHREGDLEALVAALAAPSAERGGTCSSAQVDAPALWLVDALGRAMRPTWPTDRCGSPSTRVTRALAALEETDSEKYPVQDAG